MGSPFAKLFHQSVTPILWQLHATTCLYKHDERTSDPWLTLRTKVELNASSSDPYRPDQGSDDSRQLGSFLIRVEELPQDDAGLPVMPDRYSVVLYEDRYYRAHIGQGKTCWVNEDHEGTQIRFRVSAQELSA